ncbi:hypothetical protein DSO57_1006169 [Entomophthora muscae]|uniref:Uncharacterized protein n=1 Tax=Entomophthora muscae TaxID=34485 RepID=A0ACC2USP8_9FUNG|nr:hypothetical protein DSO57_1006169 [Entomophthora muscae]
MPSQCILLEENPRRDMGAKKTPGEARKGLVLCNKYARSTPILRTVYYQLAIHQIHSA